MQCREVRELADSFLSEQLLVETNHDLLRHLEACPACRSEIAARGLLRSAIKTAFTNAESLRMPEEFRSVAVSRLRVAALHKSPGRFLGSWRQIAAAVVLLVAVGSGLFLLSGRATAAERDAAGDHRDCAILMQLHEKPLSLGDAAARYDSSFQSLQDTPADSMPTTAGLIQVLRRHSCEFDGRRFAHVVFRFQGQLVSLLVTGDVSQATQSSAGSEPNLKQLPSVNGFNVVSFKSPGHVIFMVSSLDKPQLSQVAGFLAGPVYHRLIGE